MTKTVGSDSVRVGQRHGQFIVALWWGGCYDVALVESGGCCEKSLSCFMFVATVMLFKLFCFSHFVVMRNQQIAGKANKGCNH